MASTRQRVLLAVVSLFVVLQVLWPVLQLSSSASPPPIIPTNRTFSVLGDAYILNAFGNRNFGGSSRLAVGNDSLNSMTFRSLLDFDLSSIPSTAQVINATLKLRSLATTGPGTVDAYRVRSSWLEGSGFESLYEQVIYVNETASVSRTREPVVIHVTIPNPGITAVAKADFRLFDSLGMEVPSQVYNFVTAGGNIVGLDLAFGSTNAPLESRTYTLKYGLLTRVVPAFRQKVITATPLWTYAAGSSFASPAIADLNGDGLLEVIVGATDGRVIDLQWNGTAVAPLWTYTAPVAVNYPILVTDLTGSGNQMVLFATDSASNHSITALSNTGKYLWSYNLGGQLLSSFAAADTDGNGVVEVYVGDGANKTLHVINGQNGARICSWTPGGSNQLSGVAVGDVVGTSTPEVVIAGSAGFVYVRNPDCTQATAGVRPGASAMLITPSIVNTTGDAHGEIIVGDRGNVNSKEYVLRGSDLTTLASSPALGADLASGQIIVDNGGSLDVYAISSGDGALHKLTSGMSKVWDFPGLANGTSYTIPSAADIDLDGNPEVLYGTDGSVVYAVSSTNTEVKRWVLDSRVRATPAVADLDGDGTMEVVLVSSTKVYAFGTGSLGHDTRSGSYDIANTGHWLGGNSPDGKPLLTAQFGLLRNYTSLGVSWNKRDGISYWANPGGDVDATPVASSTPVAGTWTTWNITGLVQSWVNLPPPTYSVALRAPNEALAWNVTFASKEYGGGLAPVLEVSYIVSPSPKIVGRVPDQVAAEDSPPWTLNLLPYASDPNTPTSLLHWDMTGVNFSLVQVSGLNVTGNHNITFQLVHNANGNNLVRLWLYDDQGYYDTQPLWINITPVNDPPTFDPPAILYVHYDKPYIFNFQPYMSDVDTPISSLTLTSDDSSRATVSGHNVTFLYPQSLLNQWVYVILTVSDGQYSVSQVVAVKVTSDNPPVLTKQLPNVTLTEGETRKNVFNLDNYFSDPDKDSLYFSYGFSHIIVTINADHSVDMSAQGYWSGQETVTFRATDPTGAIAEDTIIVTVIPVNQPPVLAALPPLKVHYGYPYSFDLTPYISDPDTPLSQLKVTTDDPTHVTVSSHTLTLLYPSTVPQNVPLPLTVTLSDGINSTFYTTTVTVSNDYPPQLLKTLPDVIFPENTFKRDAFDLDNYFFDNDSAYLVYTSGNVYVQVTIKTNHSVDFGAPVNWSGREMVTFRARDNQGAIAEDTIHVTVLPVDQAPAIQPLPKQVHQGLGSWVLNLAPYIYDSDNNISDLIITTGNNSRVRAVGDFLIFDYSQEALHETVIITVSDRVLASSAPIEVEVIVPSPFLFYLPYIISGAVAASIFVAYRVLRTNIEEVFLVHENGLPIAHLSRTLTPERDPDLIASMFTAIQSFARDSFRGAGAGDIHAIELGSHRVSIARGRTAYLAVLFRGRRERMVHRKAQAVIKEVEQRFGSNLESWSGMISEVEGIRQFLETFFRAKEAGTSPVDRAKGGKSSPETGKAPGRGGEPGGTPPSNLPPPPPGAP